MDSQGNSELAKHFDTSTEPMRFSDEAFLVKLRALLEPVQFENFPPYTSTPWKGCSADADARRLVVLLVFAIMGARMEGRLNFTLRV